MRHKAIGKKLVVELLEKKRGRIITEDIQGVKKDRDHGVVLSVGKDVSEIQVGDIVTFNEYAGKEWNEGGELKFILLNEDEIYTIIEQG